MPETKPSMREPSTWPGEHETLRVMFLCNSHVWGGAEAYLCSIAGALANCGHRCWIVAPPDSPLLEAAARTTGVRTLPFGVGPKLSRRSVPDFALRAKRYRKNLRDFLIRTQYELGIDVLHVQFKKEQLLATPIAEQLGIPVVWTEHGALPSAIARVPFARSRYVRCSMMTHRVLCVSGFVERDLARRGVHSSRLVTCYNGIDPEPPLPVRDRIDARQRLGLANETPMVLVVARLARVKGHHVLVAAAPEIRRAVPDVRFVFAGDGPERERLNALARKLDVSNCIDFLGHRDDVPALLAASDVVVAPSLAEGHPFSVLEAMAAERPVIGSRVGGIPEALGNGQAGVLVSPGQPRAMARAVVALLLSPARAHALGIAGRRRVHRHFTREAMIAGTEQVLLAASNRPHVETREMVAP